MSASARARFLALLAAAERRGEQERAQAQRRVDAVRRAGTRDKTAWRRRLLVARCALQQAYRVQHAALRRHAVTVCRLYRLRNGGNS